MYNLYPFQKKAVTKTIYALEKHSNTLLVSPTGSGKTVMLSFIMNNLVNVKTSIVLVHRKELLRQNYETHKKMYPNVTIGSIEPKNKTIKCHTNFGMIQTITNNLHLLLNKIDLLIVDEAHHTQANSYKKVYKHFKEINPNLMLLGVTATPNRADKKSLGSIFGNVSHQICIYDLINQGLLKMPICKTINQDQIAEALESQDSFAEAKISNASVHNNYIKETKYLKTRKAIAFTNSVTEAKAMSEFFNSLGTKSDWISSFLKEDKRKDVLHNFSHGETEVLFNCMLLTEGFDNPNINCVMILKKESSKSLMMQMIGRGLRYHKKLKKCLILDFGNTLLKHQNLLVDMQVIKNKFSNTKIKKEVLEKSSYRGEATITEYWEIENISMEKLDINHAKSPSNVTAIKYEHSTKPKGKYLKYVMTSTFKYWGVNILFCDGTKGSYIFDCNNKLLCNMINFSNQDSQKELAKKLLSLEPNFLYWAKKSQLLEPTKKQLEVLKYSNPANKYQAFLQIKHLIVKKFITSFKKNDNKY